MKKSHLGIIPEWMRWLLPLCSFHISHLHRCIAVAVAVIKSYKFLFNNFYICLKSPMSRIGKECNDNNNNINIIIIIEQCLFHAAIMRHRHSLFAAANKPNLFLLLAILYLFA